MKITKILLGIFIILSFTSCSNNPYIKTMERGYHKDKEDKTIYIKENDDFKYTKKKMRYMVYDNQHYLVIEQNKKSGKKSLYLALKYRGDDWVYMKCLDLISNKTYHIDFMARKMSTALWRDKSNLVDSVEEYIAFKLKPEEIQNLKSILNSGNVKIVYYGELDGKSEEVEVTPKEISNMKDILKLY